MNAAIYRFAPYTGSLKIEQQTFCLVHSLFQFVWLSEDVYIIPPVFHSVKYFFKKFLTVQAAGIAMGPRCGPGSEGKVLRMDLLPIRLLPFHFHSCKPGSSVLVEGVDFPVQDVVHAKG